MSVTVTAPKTRVVSRGACTFSWTPQYPQSRYEIQYRVKGVDTWSTLGVVSSGASSVVLDLSAFEDFQEYHYRIVCYSDNAQSGDTTYSGSDISPAYSIVVCPAAVVRAMRIRYGEGMLEVPLYESTGREPRFRQRTADGTCETALIPPDAAMASPARMRVGGETKALPAATAELADPGVPGSVSLDANQRNDVSYYYRYSQTLSYYYLGSYGVPFYYYRFAGYYGIGYYVSSRYSMIYQTGGWSYGYYWVTAYGSYLYTAYTIASGTNYFYTNLPGTYTKYSYSLGYYATYYRYYINS